MRYYSGRVQNNHYSASAYPAAELARLVVGEEKSWKRVLRAEIEVVEALRMLAVMAVMVVRC